MAKQITVTPELISNIIDLMSQGKSLVQVSASLGLSKKTFQKYIDNSQDLAEAIDLGMTMHEAHWEDIGDAGMYMGKEFKSDIYKAKMTHHFGWADKKQIDLDPTDFKNLSKEELDKRLLEELKKDPELQALVESNTAFKEIKKIERK